MVVEEPSRHRAEADRFRAEPLPAQPTPSPRRHELDWLRVTIILGAMVFHAIFELQLYFPQVRTNTLLQVGMQVGSTIAIQWGLPMLFLIAGASAWLSLAHRTGQQFIKERVLHILVPFIGCVLTIIPLTMYIASLIRPGPHIPFLQFYVDYFQSYAQFFQGNPVDHLLPLWGNLWFIFVIFLVSLLTLPLILLLRRPQGARVISGLAAVCRIPGGTLLAGLVLVVCSWLLGEVTSTSVESSLWLVTLYTLSYIAGVLLYADPSIERALARDAPAALLLAMLCFVIEQFLVSTNALPQPHSSGYTLSAFLAGCLPWLGVIAFLGLGKRLVNFANRALEYLKEAAFPYFLLHMLILTLFGYIFLDHTSLPAILQGVAIISCWVLTLALLYEYLIKRVSFLRFIFGMKPRPRA